MYVNPIVVGVVGMLIAEFVLIIIAAAVTKIRKGDKCEKDKNSGVPCDIDYMHRE